MDDIVKDLEGNLKYVIELEDLLKQTYLKLYNKRIILEEMIPKFEKIKTKHKLFKENLDKFNSF